MPKARPTTKADETPEFLAFWTIWKPHKNSNDGRGAARDEFFRHVEVYGVDPLDIVDGARWYIREGGNQKRAYDGSLIQQHASSWLNKRDYEDGCEAWRDMQEKLQAVQNRPANVVSMNSQPGPTGKTKFLQEWSARK